MNRFTRSLLNEVSETCTCALEMERCYKVLWHLKLVYFTTPSWKMGKYAQTALICSIKVWGRTGWSVTYWIKSFFLKKAFNDLSWLDHSTGHFVKYTIITLYVLKEQASTEYSK